MSFQIAVTTTSVSAMPQKRRCQAKVPKGSDPLIFCTDLPLSILQPTCIRRWLSVSPIFSIALLFRDEFGILFGKER